MIIYWHILLHWDNTRNIYNGQWDQTNFYCNAPPYSHRTPLHCLSVFEEHTPAPGPGGAVWGLV